MNLILNPKPEALIQENAGFGLSAAAEAHKKAIRRATAGSPGLLRLRTLGCEVMIFSYVLDIWCIVILYVCVILVFCISYDKIFVCGVGL